MGDDALRQLNKMIRDFICTRIGQQAVVVVSSVWSSNRLLFCFFFYTHTLASREFEEEGGNEEFHNPFLYLLLTWYHTDVGNKKDLCINHLLDHN